MLRMGFLPSDFNPMVLMLGEAGDFRALAGVLRQFARAPVAIRLDTAPFCITGRDALLLAPAAGCPGIERGPGELTWRVDPAHALHFAAQLDMLADPATPAGSAMLECGSGDEIAVKASRGEFTDDFLRAGSDFGG